MGWRMLEGYKTLEEHLKGIITFQDCLDNNIEGILCLDFALGYHGLSTFNHYDFPIYFTSNTEVNKESNISYQVVEEVDFSHCTELKRGIYVTNPERTICDMIKYDMHEFHLLEAIDRVYNWEGKCGVDKYLLSKLVDEYGIRERFEVLKEESNYIYDEV